MSLAKLNAKQASFLKLYTGQSDIAGNATRCYIEVYGCASSERVSQSAASRLLGHPMVQACLNRAEKRAFDQLEVNAGYVLNQSIRLYDRAMGDEPYPVEVSTTDKETGEETISVVQRRSYSPSTARQTLEMIGKHKAVQAFSEVVEHTHKHYLESALAARSKAVEARATKPPGGNGRITEGIPSTDEAAGAVNEEARRLMPPEPEEVRGSIKAEVNPKPEIASEKPGFQRRGATGE